MEHRTFFVRCFLSAVFATSAGVVKAITNFDQLDFGDFERPELFLQNVQPVSYEIHMTLPLELAKEANWNVRYVAKGSMALTFRWGVQPDFPAKRRPTNNEKNGNDDDEDDDSQRLIVLHSKLISIEEESIRVYHQQSDQRIKMVIESIRQDPDEELLLVKLHPAYELVPENVYVIEIEEFYSRVEEHGSKNGIFLTAHGVATQFQLSEARKAFPCVDAPDKKAIFKFSITHPISYRALSNTDPDSNVTSNLIGWRRTNFFPSPLMSTYIVAFSLIPTAFEGRRLSKTFSDGVRLSLYYDPERLTNSPDLLLNFASRAYHNLRSTFAVRLPLAKLDVSVTTGLSILGMENWGLINLKEEFVNRETEPEVFGLLTHEIVHQWIGDLATTANWRDLCVQEGLTEHFARRTLADVYGHDSEQYQRYIFVRYLPAVHNETNNVGLKPLRQNFRGFDEAAAFCFGRSPFVWSMLERLVGGRREFDQLINRFLVDYAYRSFLLDDLISYFDLSDNVSYVLRYFVEHGGYPSVFVERTNASVYRLSQRQIVPLRLEDSGDTRFEVPSGNDVWPVPLTLVGRLEVMNDTEMWLDVDRMPVDERGVPMLNFEFAYFYRVNFESGVWNVIADALLDHSHAYTDTAISQFLSDFCFFRGLDLVSVSELQDPAESLDVLTRKFVRILKDLEERTGIYVSFYTRGC